MTNTFTPEDRAKLGRYHDGTHGECVSCRMLRHIDVQEARIAVLEAALRKLLKSLGRSA